MRKSHKRWLRIAGALSLVLLSLLFVLRGTVVRAYVTHKVAAVAAKHHLDITYSNLDMAGISRVTVERLSVVPHGGEPLLTAAHIAVKLNPWKLLFLRAETTYAEFEGVTLHFVKEGNRSNFDFLYAHSSAERDTAPPATLDYGVKSDKLLTLLFGLLPSDARVSNLEVSYRNDDYAVSVRVPSLVVEAGAYAATIHSNEEGHKGEWISSGYFDRGSRILKGVLHGVDSVDNVLPFLNYRLGATLRFDTITFTLKAPRIKDRVQSLEGSARLAGLNAHHKRISPDEVFLHNASIDYHARIHPQGVELDSSSLLLFNRLRLRPYLLLERSPQWRIRAALTASHFPADDLFASLPTGLFEHIEGIRATGNLSYNFLLDVDIDNPDSLLFNSELRREGFSLKSYGRTDLRRMNAPFLYTAYENGTPVSSFEIGPTSPWFRPLSTISPILQMCVLQSEDGGFFHHNGFSMEGIRGALIQDIKERRFARGGSTISMQLVKNVFLSRSKTLARKIEEMMIVWLIEGGYLTSKERMFEVYLNLIEWGPGIYGAAQASHFYFDKEPSQLTVNESIFLSSIIPRPTSALYQFTDSLTLRPHLAPYYRTMALRLRVKEVITSDEETMVAPDITLQGRAREILLRRTASPLQEE